MPDFAQHLPHSGIVYGNAPVTQRLAKDNVVLRGF